VEPIRKYRLFSIHANIINFRNEAFAFSNLKNNNGVNLTFEERLNIDNLVEASVFSTDQSSPPFDTQGVDGLDNLIFKFKKTLNDLTLIYLKESTPDSLKVKQLLHITDPTMNFLKICEKVMNELDKYIKTYKILDGKVINF
jgi:hypothetical protein